LILGRQIIRFPEIDSTSDEARRQVKLGAGEGLVVVAERQTAGRGKPGSRWHSPPGNLYFSVVLKPFRNPGELPSITLVGALAVRRFLAQAGCADAVIKWPNDVLVHGRKISGILTERLPSGHLIIGVGVNLNALPAEAGESATSLFALTGKKYDLTEGLTGLLAELEREYLAYLGKFC
jgi:BirA family transcriptional regulator, biotin operon repressor / biotin---[acetyl-CoA-carboxylase] ligase